MRSDEGFIDTVSEMYDNKQVIECLCANVQWLSKLEKVNESK